MEKLPYQPGIDALRKARKNGKLNKSATANLVIQTKDDAIVISSQGCHAGLSTHTRVAKTYVISGIQEFSSGQVPDTMKIPYLQWLLNDSPFADAFVSKDPEWCLREGVIIGNVNAPSNILAGGMQSSRRLWEMSYIVENFYHLTKAGVNANLSFVLAHFIHPWGNFGQIKFQQSSSAHVSISAYQWGPKSLKRWLEGVPVAGTPNVPYVEDSSYLGINKLFEVDRTDGGMYSKWLAGFKLTKEQGPVKASNPFIAAKKAVEGNAKTFKLTDVVEEIATNLQHKILEEVGYGQGSNNPG